MSIFESKDGDAFHFSDKLTNAKTKEIFDISLIKLANEKNSTLTITSPKRVTKTITYWTKDDAFHKYSLYRKLIPDCYPSMLMESTVGDSSDLE
jgi:hypothetical protein